ncbi:MAG: response regulator [Marinobacter sp.]
MTDPIPPPIVLVADDDPDDCLMIREAFAECCQDCHLCFVHDGVQLMRILNQEAPLPGDPHSHCGRPDLVLLDLNMPLKDGRQSLLEIKTNPHLKNLPTIIMTTSRNEDDIRYCYDNGANSYIVKPARYSELLAIVTALEKYWINTVSLPTRLEKYD